MNPSRGRPLAIPAVTPPMPGPAIGSTKPLKATRPAAGPVWAARALETGSTWILQRPRWIRWTLVLLLLAAATAAVWYSGGTARAMPHLFYLPILTAAYLFGLPGTMITAGLATLLCGPLMPLLTDPGTGQATSSWLLRGIFFLGIGAVAVAALAAQRRAEERHVTADVLHQLRRSPDRAVDSALVPLVAGMIASRSFHTVLQPVYALKDGRLIGVEALTRFDSTVSRSPDRWFAAADSIDQGVELELAAITRALAAGAALPRGVSLSINASPATLADPRLAEMLRARRHPDVTVEITEHAVVEDYPLLRDTTERLRDLGVRIAVDDAGAGVASLHHILQLAPDAIKLDLSLTQDMSSSSLRRSLATALVDFAYRTNALLIVEGIETEADLAAWRALGAHAVQGNFTGRPTRDVPPLFNRKVISARVAGPRFPSPRRPAARSV